MDMQIAVQFLSQNRFVDATGSAVLPQLDGGRAQSVATSGAHDNQVSPQVLSLKKIAGR